MTYEQQRRVTMSLLSQLNWTDNQKNTVTTDPVQTRRVKLLKGIAAQKAQLICTMEGREYQTDKKKVSKWYWMAADGSYYTAIKYGSRHIEVYKGKTSIKANSIEDLISIYETVEDAVKSGELDKTLQSVAQRVAKKK